jgi:hypothetical protein
MRYGSIAPNDCKRGTSAALAIFPRKIDRARSVRRQIVEAADAPRTEWQHAIMYDAVVALSKAGKT